MAGLAHRLFDDAVVARGLRRERVIRDRRNPLDMYDDVELHERFRFRRHSLLELIDELRNDLQYDTNRNAALSPELQVLIALRFFASGCFQNHVGDMIGVDKSTACRAIRRVAVALQRRLPQYIYMPQDAEVLAQAKEQFHALANFPNVVACVDGTHIKIIAPAVNEWEYVNRKGYHSINVQLMCDANLRIVNCVVRWPGATHDSRILTESEIYRWLENPDTDFVVLGDSGYPLKNWLMVPFLNPRNEAERAYNRAHMTTRSTIERCNGVLKRRFFCLHTGLRMNPHRACTVIMAALVLHNKCIMAGEVVDIPQVDNDDANQGNHVPDGNREQQADINGRIVRQQMVANHFSVV